MQLFLFHTNFATKTVKILFYVYLCRAKEYLLIRLAVMKAFIIKYWWSLPLCIAIIMISLMLLFVDAPTFWDHVVGCLLILVILLTIGSWVVLLMNKLWMKSILSIVTTILVLCVLGFPLILFASFAPDGFGKEHPIPAGMKYNIPLCSNENEGDMTGQADVVVDSLERNSYLQIREEGEHGHYQYSFYYKGLPKGDIFLRCYEVTENIPLSEDVLPQETTVFIDSTHSFCQLVNNRSFTIYEGDWGDYYAARVEVWHRNVVTKEEKKLMEKIYRVEGWER